MATAVAGWRLGINPFDQPNVESAKVLARNMVKAYETSGALPPIVPTGHGDGLTVYAAPKAGGALPAAGAAAGSANAADVVRDFLRGVRPGDYIALAGVRDADGRDDGGAAAVAGRVPRPAPRGHDRRIRTPLPSLDRAAA